MRDPFDDAAARALDDVDEMTDGGGFPPRTEKREPVVRIVEYSRYPRIERSERRLIGFTRNQSRSGMCIVASEPEVEGTLLRVALRTVDGGAALEALAHVAWCDRREDGRYWIGLALLERAGRQMRKVRRAPADERDERGESDERGDDVRLFGRAPRSADGARARLRAVRGAMR